jgi:NAD-dependent deacetylase
MKGNSLAFSEITPELVDHMINAQHITVLTGAGISAESGIPTFREARTGLWKQYRPEDLATPHAFEKDPELVWRWYLWRSDLVQQAHPNPGHFALAAMEQHVPHFNLVTQNVDGFHQRAGSQQVIELHGNILHARCVKELTEYPLDTKNLKLPPRCPNCGAYLRPNVVWFGEPLPAHALEDAIQASETASLFFSIGTSGIVEPAASLPYLALRNNATVIEINPEPTPLTVYAAHYLPYPAGSVLPELIKAVWPDSMI